LILKSLKLENFLAHEKTEIEFSEDGITVFIGDNGAGKSSILEGIVFALYGSSSKGKISQLVKWGKKQAKIELEFIKDSSNYKIYREITLTGKSHSSTSAVYKKQNGAYRLFYQKNVNKEIPKITGLTSKTFLTSVLVKQGDIEGLIELKPKNRAKVFEELLDMTIYQLLSEEFGKKRRELEKEINTILSVLPDEKEIQQNIEILNKEKENLIKEKENLLQEKKEIEKDIENHKKEYENLLKQSQLKTKLESKITSNKKQIEILQNTLLEKENTFKEIEKKEKDLTVLEKDVNNLKEKQEILNRYLEGKTLKERLKSLKEKENQIKEKEKIYKKYKNVAEKYLSSQEKLKEINQELKILSKNQGEIKSLEERKNKVAQKLNTTYKEALKIAKELTEIKKIFKTLQLNPELVNTMIRDSKTLIGKYIKEREEIVGEYKSIKNKIKELNQQIKDISLLKGDCPTCLRPIEEHSKEEILEDLNKKIKQLEEKLKKVEEKGKTIKHKKEQEEIVLSLLEEYKKWYEKHKEAQKEKQDIDSKLFVLNQKIKNVEKLEKEKQTIEKFLAENEENYQLFNEASRFLKSTDREKISKEIQKIENKIKDYPENVNQKKLEEEIKELKEKEKLYIKYKEFVLQKEKLKNEIKNTKENIDRLKKEIKEIDKNLKSLKDIEEKLNKSKKILESLEEKQKTVYKNLEPINKQLGEIEGKIESLKEEIKKLKENLKKIENLQIKLEKYKKLENALGINGIQKIIRDSALERLPVMTETIFKAFGFEFSQIRFSENFDIKIQVPTYERKDRYIPVDAISGGQKVALGIALRLALSNFLGNRSEFLILDEPTVHLDQQRKEELINILLKLKEKNFIKQLIIVTHDREIEDAADQIYYVEKGEVRKIA